MVLKKGQSAQKLTVGVFIALLTVGGILYVVNEGDVPYHCEATDLVGICWKLSNINPDGFQTRCYYDDETPKKYKVCKSGWNEFSQNITGIPIPVIQVIDIDFPEEDDEILNFKGIYSPIIGQCLRIDNFTCTAIIFEENGINKKLTVTYRFCNNESVINETTVCNQWTDLNQTQIGSELKSQATNLLNNIIDIEKGRNKIEQKINLTQQVEINI